MADSEHPFTCLSCAIAYAKAEDQREHYRSDHHHYNMKRRVAGLPPVTVAIFNQKVMERKAETAVMSSLKGSTCDVCNKIYTTENAYRSHINSKKHRENELKAASKPRSRPPPKTAPEDELEYVDNPLADGPKVDTPDAKSPDELSRQAAALKISEESNGSKAEDEPTQTFEQRLAATRTGLSPASCLYCTHTAPSLEDNLTHMAREHSFFIPDAEYLVDLPGLIQYLGEKIALGNMCTYCNPTTTATSHPETGKVIENGHERGFRGREFRSLDAVRKHMIDKSHCKIAYDTEEERMELVGFYDFSSSYPDAEARKKRREERKARKAAEKAKVDEEEGWEEVDEDEDIGPADEVIEEEVLDISGEDSDSSLSDEDDGQLTYGDTAYELVLPSGARIGHRSMRRYYTQSLPRSSTNNTNTSPDPNSGTAMVHRLLAQRNSALVPVKGGGTIKARNAGEAREAGRHIREFRDVKRREQFKTAVAFRNNNQKHFRDPLLQ